MKKTLYYIICATVILSGCVPKRALINEKRKERLRVDALKMDSTTTHSQLYECSTSLTNCNSDYTDIKTSLQDLSSTSEAKLNSSNKTIQSSKMTIADQARRLKTLEGLIQKQKDNITKLQKTVTDALVNFKSDELVVTMKNGKLYVSLQEKLLFNSGSAVVDPKGKEALSTLAAILDANPDINVEVEGHTDNVPIHDALYTDNWSLSVARSVSIVRVLTVTDGVSATRVIASGRGQYCPTDNNATAEGRSRNRRTEIILSPNLSEIYKILNQ